MNIVKFNKNLNRFYERFTDGLQLKWGWQRWKHGADDVSFVPDWCRVCRRHVRCDHHKALHIDAFRRHFDQSIWHLPHTSDMYSGLGQAGQLSGRRVKWLCIDLDSPKSCKLFQDHLIPLLEACDIDYVWEASGPSLQEKCHVWILFDCTIDLQKSFLDAFLFKCGLEDWRELKRTDKDIKIEFYPYQYPSNLIRQPGCFHLRIMRVPPCIDRLGNVATEAEDIVEMFCGMRVLESHHLVELTEKLTPGKLEAQAKKKDSKRAVAKASQGIRERFTFQPLNLRLPYFPVPPPTTIDKIAKNCPAVNKLIELTMEQKFLEGAGDDVHKWGLWLDNMVVFDQLYFHNDGSTGERFKDFIYEHKRNRSSVGHNWHEYKDALLNEPARLIPGCATWESVFGLCKGCRWKEVPNFSSPRDFVIGEAIDRYKFNKLELVTNKDVRTIQFPKAAGEISASLIGKSPLDLVLNQHTGSGKSHFTDQLVAQCVTAGHRTLLITPTAKVALQHYTNLDRAGAEPFLVMSHEKLFTPEVMVAMGTAHPCPAYDEIQHLLTMGMSSGTTKTRYCSRCPYASVCPYPRQYKNACEPKHQVVIAQHAHMGVRDVLAALVTSGFDFLVIDEDFVDACLSELKVSAADLKVLKILNDTQPKLEPILNWVEGGGYPTNTRLGLQERDLEELMYLYEQLGREWILPDLLRAWRAGSYYHTVRGVFNFTPPPRISTRLITDATAPVDYLRVILNSKTIRLAAGSQVHDIRNYHPDNEYIQALDSTTSRRQMSQPGYLETMLELCGRILTDQYPELPGLITVYQNQKEQARAYLNNKFPGLLDRVAVSHLERGTNDHVDKNVQMLLATHYPNAWDYAYEEYRLIQARNFWVRATGAWQNETWLESFMYPDFVDRGSGYATIKKPLYRYELIDGNAYEVSYPQFKVREPATTLRQIIQQRFRADKHQAARLRPRDNHLTICFDFDKEPTDHLVTRSFRLAEFMARFVWT